MPDPTMAGEMAEAYADTAVRALVSDMLDSRERYRAAAEAAFFGAVAAALIAMMVLPGCSSGGGSSQHALRSTSWGRCTERAMLSSASGHIGACVDYQYKQGHIDVSSVAASFRSSSSYPNPYFSFTFLNPDTKEVDFQFVTPEVPNNFTFSHSTRLINLARHPRARKVPSGDVLRVSLHAVNTRKASVYEVVSVSLTLNKKGFQCPNPDSIGKPSC